MHTIHLLKANLLSKTIQQHKAEEVTIQWLLFSYHLPVFASRLIVLSLCGAFFEMAISSCTIFTTRTPEPPDTRRSSFQPPTSTQIVIANLQGAIREKNIENYIQCLVAGDSGTAQQRFLFDPSSEAAARFASVFIGWNVVRERQSFTAFLAKIPTGSSPVIQLSNERFELMSPDSAVFVADYRIRPNAEQNGVAPEFAGRMRLTIVSFTGGFWAIRRWSDQTLAQPPSTAESWSVLKAQFAN